MRFRLFLAPILVTLLLTASSARADPSLDLAMEADSVNQEHCADLYSSQVGQAASSTLVVAEVWGRLSEVYETSKAPYLLYWRGVLAQCLGRDDAAVEDLNAFVASQEGQTMFDDLVRKAKARLRRLGGAGQVGQGAAAEFLRGAPLLEVELAYVAGSGLHELSCTDDPQRSINGRCAGSSNWVSQLGPAAALVGASGRVDVFPTRGFGVGARVSLDAAPTGSLTGHPPEPTVVVAAGPHLRILDSVSSGGRAGWLRLEVRFAASFTRLAPMVGVATWADVQGFLDAGIWALRHVGPAVWLGGAVELSPAAIFEIGGHFAWFAPGADGWTERVDEGGPRDIAWEEPVAVGVSGVRSESVQSVPTLVRGSQLRGGLRLGVLFADKANALAVGPVLAADLNRAALVFEDRPDDEWCGSVECGLGNREARKVYSTQRHDVLVRVGVELRFGVKRPD